MSATSAASSSSVTATAQGKLIRACLGSAWAATLGDALGMPFEGHSPSRISRQLQLSHVTLGGNILASKHGIIPATPMGLQDNLIGWEKNSFGAGHRPLFYTDDTNAAVALLRSLLDCKGKVNGKDIGYRHARQFIDLYADGPVRGCPGSATRTALAILFSGKSAHACATSQFETGSFANGLAMKIWPLAVRFVPLYYFSSSQKQQEGEKESEALSSYKKQLYHAVTVAGAFTHCNPQAIDGAAVLCHLICFASQYYINNNNNNSRWETKRDGIKLLDEALSVSRYEGIRKKISILRDMLQSSAEPEAEKEEEEEKKEEKIDESETKQLIFFLSTIIGKDLGFQISTESAIICVLCIAARHGPHVQRVVSYSCLIGGDTDTIASMTGAISGALAGSKSTSNSSCSSSSSSSQGEQQEQQEQAEAEKEFLKTFSCPAIYDQFENGRFGRDFILSKTKQLAELSLLEASSSQGVVVEIIEAGNEAAETARERDLVDDECRMICGKFWQQLWHNDLNLKQIDSVMKNELSESFQKLAGGGGKEIDFTKFSNDQIHETILMILGPLKSYPTEFVKPVEGRFEDLLKQEELATAVSFEVFCSLFKINTSVQL